MFGMCVCGVIGRDMVYGHEMTISGTLYACVDFNSLFHICRDYASKYTDL